MTVLAIRFRAEGALVVLQVLAEEGRNLPGMVYVADAKWRDAKVEDLLAASELMRSRRAGTGDGPS